MEHQTSPAHTASSQTQFAASEKTTTAPGRAHISKTLQCKTSKAEIHCQRYPPAVEFDTAKGSKRTLVPQRQEYQVEAGLGIAAPGVTYNRLQSQRFPTAPAADSLLG